MPRKMLRPPIKMRKRFAPLLERCRELILTSPSQTSGTDYGDATIFVVCRWPLREGHRPSYKVPDLPADFPTGMVVERTDENVTIRHNVVSVLKWAKAKHFTDYDAADLFARRLPAMMVLSKMELKLERLLEGVDVDLPQDMQDKIDNSQY
jgi:hypothetical protein